jgi:hypothetical protein
MFPIFPSGEPSDGPSLRASNEHSSIVRVLRARRAPGRSLLFLLSPRLPWRIAMHSQAEDSDLLKEQ